MNRHDLYQRHTWTCALVLFWNVPSSQDSIAVRKDVMVVSRAVSPRNDPPQKGGLPLFNQTNNRFVLCNVQCRL